ncbi:cbb3-type cytochrome oxidase assembly protein CcoS [Thiomicrorhabdus sp. 6S2-11]|uniref:Cbb3-type cytochrome oxidase assembly protein CcoS n=1 Tax=Thiomicrorhabdus marina TaxID=2818442 RepID=A0ABS3Q2G0_9GAMM|nr:cbb3-type cytochrome oxidase assembly protein CcoS [Thiomicrorhabdus marina]MBO1926517.1 cbb3-type cytochrome oxidase assembly protein CcoS [Thiomicrorhabdus marina]
MDVIYVLIPFVLLFGFLVVVAFIWMAKKGFFEDMDGQAHRILMDDDDVVPQDGKKSPQKESESAQAEKNTDKSEPQS